MARLFLCECGPIIKGAVDLDALEKAFAGAPGVLAVKRHATLCSEAGCAFLEADLREHPGEPVVIAACSPREHDATFRAALLRADANPFLLGRANIREQGGWVTPDRGAATRKAEATIRAAISRVHKQVPLTTRDIECRTDVLVVGSGIAGLTAARLLAQAGRKVVIVERSAAIGGKIALLGELFPNLECASCMLEPILDEVLHDPRIEVLTQSDIAEVLGSFGNFVVKIRKNARHVDVSGCYGCRTCHAACPVEVPSEIDFGLTKRRAIHIPYAGALPNASVVDENTCRHFSEQECDACVSACPFGNINLDEACETIERQAGAIIIATGAEPQAVGRPESEQLVSGVLSPMVLERLLNTSGPSGGKLQMADGQPPRSIALVHCVNPDLTAPSRNCSKICCMTMAKYAHQIGHGLPETNLYLITWDRCVGGKGYREFAASLDGKSGVTLLRLGAKDQIRVEPNSIPGQGARVIFSKSGAPHELNVDLAVVFPPMVGGPGTAEVAKTLRLPLDQFGFIYPAHDTLRAFSSRVEGVLLAGTSQGPKDASEAASHGAAAAGSALSALVPGRKLTIEPITVSVDPDRCGGCRLCARVCPFSALSFDTEKKVSMVNDLVCRGCGSCVAACPSAAITAQQFTDAQIQAEIRSYARSSDLEDGS